MLLGDPRQSDQRTQSFHFPIVVHQSLDPAAQSSAQAPSSLSFTCTSKFERSTGSDSVRVRTRRCVGSARRRGNHMHDHSRFQRDINDDTGVSLSLSLSLSQKSLTHNIGSASALPIIFHQSNPHMHQQHTVWAMTFRSELSQPFSSQIVRRERKPTNTVYCVN